MVEVKFSPSGLRGEFDAATSVLDAARSLGVDLDSVCGGRAICGRCAVVPAGPIEPSLAERQLRSRRTIEEDQRLACCLTVGDAPSVAVPAESQIHRPIVRKGLTAALDDLVIDPATTLRYLDHEEARDLVPPSLVVDWPCPRDAGLGLDGVTVALRDDAVVGAWPGFVETVYGVAIDVGSTTIAAHLADLATGEVLASAGSMNPQIRFGDDLMSRVSYVMLDPESASRTRARECTSILRTEIARLILELAKTAAIEHDQIVEIVLVANPIMHHFVLGFDVRPLGVAPFTLATDAPIDLAADALDLDPRFARVHVLPCIAGHVGADAAAVVLADRPDGRPGTNLVIDVGTNAELVLAHDGELWAASSPTGPAFEGAQISCGQRATVGAIERVRIDPTTLEARVKVIGCDLWSDDPSFAARAPAITGVCGSGIVEAIGELVRAGVIRRDGIIDGTVNQHNSRIVPDERTYAYVLVDEPRLLVTQNDVRAIQLAKAALVAGGKLLMERAGVSSLERIALAGAFGSHLDPDYARTIDLVPRDGDPSIESIGNAAGTGALRALLSMTERRTIADLAPRIIKIETATEPSFQAHFVDALSFGGATPRNSTRRRGGRSRVVTAQEAP
jgi:uncharacterized 2Fe-2S/4Fe-4S cluster protein (DUF4445 family)